MASLLSPSSNSSNSKTIMGFRRVTLGSPELFVFPLGLDGKVGGSSLVIVLDQVVDCVVRVRNMQWRLRFGSFKDLSFLGI